MPLDRSAIHRFFVSRFIWASYVLAAVVAVSFAGRLFWAFDLSTHFRAQYAAAGLLLALGLVVGRRYRAALFPLALGLINAGFLAPFYLPHDEPSAPSPDATRLKIVSLNVYVGSQAYGDVIDYIRAAEPDLVVLTEVTPAWRAGLKPLEEEYPEQHFAARTDAFGIALIAKPKLSNVRIEPLGSQPCIQASFSVDGRRVTLFGAHPPPPMGSGPSKMRNQAFTALNGLVRNTNGATIVAGDFNSTSWSPHFADLLAGTNLRDSRLGRGLQPSWSMTHPAPLHIPIDHILVSPEVHVFERRLGPKVGSDHLPVEMEFGLRP